MLSSGLQTKTGHTFSMSCSTTPGLTLACDMCMWGMQGRPHLTVHIQRVHYPQCHMCPPPLTGNDLQYPLAAQALTWNIRFTVKKKSWSNICVASIYPDAFTSNWFTHNRTNLPANQPFLRPGHASTCQAAFSKHWPSGPMLSISQFVHMSVCVFVCLFTFEVPFTSLFVPTS